jgi:cytochrome c553
MRRTFRHILLLPALGAACGFSFATEAVSPRVLEIAEQRCGACHGPGGQGENARYPKLSGQNLEYLVQQMFNFKSGARKSIIMSPQLADLTGGELTQLAQHFAGQSLVPKRTTDKALIEAGRSIFLQGNPASKVTACAVCHGSTARGAQMLPRLAGQHAEYLETQLRSYIERSRTADQATMHSVASKLTHPEIHAVSYFLSGLD